jgi:hypothetical protein
MGSDQRTENVFPKVIFWLLIFKESVKEEYKDGSFQNQYFFQKS